MTLLSRRVVWVFIASFLIAALVLTAVATAPMVAGAGGDRADRRFENLTAVHIGGGALASQVTGCLEDAKGHVVRSARIPEALGLDRATVVVFGDEWFEQRVDDAELHDFLRLASSQGAGMVMAGGATSEFFEALHRAGVYRMAITETGETRNPAHSNPPLVGFVMKEVGGHTGPSLLFSHGSSPDVLAESLDEWLGESPDESASSDTAAVLSGSQPAFVHQFYYVPLLDSNPHGRLNLIVDLSKGTEGGYDWYFYSVRTQSVPGIVAYGSNWRTTNTWAHHEVRDAGTNRWLVDYDPTTTSGQSSVAVSLSASAGPSGPSAGFGMSWSYAISDVVVWDYSDYYHNRAYWLHVIDSSKPPGMATYQSRPGFVVKTKQGYRSTVNAWYQVRFRNFWNKTLGPVTIQLDSPYSGGGGGCPILHVWDGSDYVEEGLLDIGNPEGVDVVYTHALATSPEGVAGAYRVRLVEHPLTTSYIDQVKLYAILEDGTRQELPLRRAYHSEDGNVLPMLLHSDDWRVDLLGAEHNDGMSQSIDLEFAALNPNADVISFILEIEGHNPFVIK